MLLFAMGVSASWVIFVQPVNSRLSLRGKSSSKCIHAFFASRFLFCFPVQIWRGYPDFSKALFSFSSLHRRINLPFVFSCKFNLIGRIHASVQIPTEPRCALLSEFRIVHAMMA